jgi:hypothetical protein
MRSTPLLPLPLLLLHQPTFLGILFLYGLLFELGSHRIGS